MSIKLPNGIFCTYQPNSCHGQQWNYLPQNEKKIVTFRIKTLISATFFVFVFFLELKLNYLKNISYDLISKYYVT